MMTNSVFTGARYRELSTWPIDKLRAFANNPGPQGQPLEAVRELAQAHAYQPDDSRQNRLEWAKLSLLINDRMHGDHPGQRARRATQNFMLRTWIIDNLGPDPTDADWDPDALAADTLAELSLDPDEALGLAQHWRELPAGQIGELRRHKNMTRHLPTLTRYVTPGPTRDRLLQWIKARRQLP
jgi:hypothetical protein